MLGAAGLFSCGFRFGFHSRVRRRVAWALGLCTPGLGSSSGFWPGTVARDWVHGQAGAGKPFNELPNLLAVVAIHLYKFDTHAACLVTTADDAFRPQGGNLHQKFNLDAGVDGKRR